MAVTSSVSCNRDGDDAGPVEQDSTSVTLGEQ
jgi:hypothetical protein